jgi:hypothetical protein
MGLTNRADPGCRCVMKVTTARELVSLTLLFAHC